jgi:hypothetical protein
MEGSFSGSPAFIGKFVLGRFNVSLISTRSLFLLSLILVDVGVRRKLGEKTPWLPGGKFLHVFRPALV